MTFEALEIARSRKNFYRDCYRKATKLLLFSLLIIIGLVVAIVYVKLTQPVTEFYATSNNGGIRPIKALSAPNMSATPLID